MTRRLGGSPSRWWSSWSSARRRFSVRDLTAKVSAGPRCVHRRTLAWSQGPGVAIPPGAPVTRLVVETDEDRDARFAPMNDRLWGAGNWLRCPTCPLDSEGREVYHHVDAHGPPL